MKTTALAALLLSTLAVACVTTTTDDSTVVVAAQELSSISVERADEATTVNIESIVSIRTVPSPYEVPPDTIYEVAGPDPSKGRRLWLVHDESADPDGANREAWDLGLDVDELSEARYDESFNILLTGQRTVRDADGSVHPAPFEARLQEARTDYGGSPAGDTYPDAYIVRLDGHEEKVLRSNAEPPGVRDFYGMTTVSSVESGITAHAYFSGKEWRPTIWPITATLLLQTSTGRKKAFDLKKFLFLERPSIEFTGPMELRLDGLEPVPTTDEYGNVHLSWEPVSLKVKLSLEDGEIGDSVRVSR